MAGHIMIVEGVATQRILLQSTLETARFAVTCVSQLDDVLPALKGSDVDIVFLDMTTHPKRAAATLRKLNLRPQTQRPSTIALIDGAPGERMMALRAGAIDVMERGDDNNILLARVRRILRRRDDLIEMCPSAANSPAFELAESGAPTLKAVRTVVLSSRQKMLIPPMLNLMNKRPHQYEVHQSTVNFPTANDTPTPDLIIIDGLSDFGSALSPGNILRLLSDLRSRSRLRQASQLVIVPSNAGDLASLALDMGADDVVTELVTEDELSHRIDLLIQHKHHQDSLRTHVQSGLEAAIRDALTDLFNRRHALPYIASLVDKARTTHEPLSLLMIDVDHFKAVNDDYGHDAGDEVLVAVANRLRDCLRNRDMVARLGGEEFVVALPQTGVDAAMVMAERLRRDIASLSFEAPEKTGHDATRQLLRYSVTISIGISTLTDSTLTAQHQVTKMLKSADEAMYLAKSEGRNTVRVAAS